MIVYHKMKGRPSGVQPKEKKQKKNPGGFSIVLRDKSKKVNNSKVKQGVANSEIIEFISDCIKNKKLIEFEYTNKNGQAQVRNVEPYEVKSVNGASVLYGLCLQSEGLRMFVIANMRNVRVLEINGRSESK